MFKPGFHMIVTVGDASPRQARGHIGDGCVKWEHFLNDVADVADQTGTVRGRIERVEMSLKRGFQMIITAIVSICRRLIGDTSPKRRRLLRSYGNQALPKTLPSARSVSFLIALFALVAHPFVLINIPPFLLTSFSLIQLSLK